MAIFTTLAKIFHQIFKSSWAWQNFYPAKIFTYTVMHIVLYGTVLSRILSVSTVIVITMGPEY